MVVVVVMVLVVLATIVQSIWIVDRRQVVLEAHFLVVPVSTGVSSGCCRVGMGVVGVRMLGVVQVNIIKCN